MALALPESTQRDLAAWQQIEIADLEGVRLVAAVQLHITLAFLGNRPAAEVEPIAAVVKSRATGATGPLELPKSTM